MPSAPPLVSIGRVDFGRIRDDQIAFTRGRGLQLAAATFLHDFDSPPGIAHGNYRYEASPGLAPPPGADAWRSEWMSAAELPGTNGAFDTIILRDLRPFILAWDEGATLSGVFMSPIPTPYRVQAITQADVDKMPYVGWPVVFYSKARRETMSIYVVPGRTVAILVHWTARGDGAPSISASDARQRLVEAMTDSRAQSVEEMWGVDYFLGTPFENGTKPPELPCGPGSALGLSIARSEPLFVAPSFAAPLLITDFGREVWRFDRGDSSCSSQPETTRGDGAFRDVGGAAGVVDARTGAVIRFRRPYRDHFARSVTYPSPPSPP